MNRKKTKYIFMLIGVVIVVFNLSGNDDMNIILFLSSPLLWFTESKYSSIHPQDLPIVFYYISVIVFWFLIGILMERVFKYFNWIKKR
ncbi:MAG: hypothetical protein U9Q80_04180 [Bacillota bacterium]|nr:hypothetical protein [Bacillota bacterium]